MIFLFIIFVNLLPFHGPLEASETDIHEDGVEPDPRGSVALEGHGKNFQVDADGQTKTAKEIGKDFAESSFSMSHANGENKTVLDDIIRLNNLSLQAFYKIKLHGDTDPKFGWLVRAKKNKTVLTDLYEGDMVLDEKDLAVMGMFVMPTAEEVEQFSGPNDDVERSTPKTSQDDEKGKSENDEKGKTNRISSNLLGLALKQPTKAKKATPSKSFLKTLSLTQTTRRRTSTRRRPTPTSRRTSVTTVKSTQTRTRRTSTRRSSPPTFSRTTVKTMEPSSSLDFLSLVSTSSPVGIANRNQNNGDNEQANNNGIGDENFDKNDNNAYDDDNNNNEDDGAGNNDGNENKAYIEIDDIDGPFEAIVNPTSSAESHGTTRYTTETHRTSAKHSTTFRTSKRSTTFHPSTSPRKPSPRLQVLHLGEDKSSNINEGAWDGQLPPQTSLLLPTQNQQIVDRQQQEPYHQQQQQQQQSLRALPINTYTNESAQAIKRNPFPGLLDMVNKHIQPLLNIQASHQQNPFLKKMKEVAKKNLDDPKKMKYNIDDPKATPLGRKLWVSRVVPYYIAHKGTNRWSQAKLEKKLISIMNFISAVSCVQFRRRTKKDKNSLVIIRGSGCYADIGRKYWFNGGRAGMTRMSIGDWCTNDGIILHLFLHVLGFLHESNRPDRDSFVKVDLKEVLPDYRKEFRRHFQYDYTIQSTPYDYRSILHFSENAYDVRPNNDLSYTLTNVFDRNEPLGGTVLTKYNILAINKLYHCGEFYREANKTVQEKGVSDWSAWSNSCLMINNRCVRIRQRMCLNEDLSFCPTVDKFGVEDEFERCVPADCETELLVPHWSNWGPPTPICSKTCGRGIWTQRRKCDNPSPIDKKYTCVGHNHRSGICKVHKCHPGPFDTDFENGWGTWSRNFQYSTLWNIISGPSEIRDTGSPDGDHTIPGNGSYAVLQARDPFKHMQKVGELISQPLNTTDGPRCVVFYYVMNGKSVKSLQFYLRVNNKYHKVWSRNGHQGNYWQRGAFSIPQLNFSIQVVLDGITGLANTSDIAVDDFQLNHGQCPVGIEGCFDYFDECNQWRQEGLCITQFDILIFSCCKTCQYEEYKGKEVIIGKNYHEG